MGLRITNILESVSKRKKYFESIRPVTQHLHTFKPRMVEAAKRLKDLYPAAIFPPTTFAIGTFGAFGTADGGAGQLIGAEFLCDTNTVVKDELGDWERSVIADTSTLSGIVVHELIHIEQQTASPNTLLGRSINEGAADFITQLILGYNINSKIHTYGNAQGIYSDRATAFRVFDPIWQREQNIRIVGSTIEGFKRGIGIEARELILPKLTKNKESTVHLLLTHASFAKLREGPEKEHAGYITNQIRATTQMLQEIKNEKQTVDRLKWKYFKGAPTCFMILAGEFMLLNPYLYMQAAYFNFSMIVKDTNSPFDIYNHYKKYHFQKAWDDFDLSTEEAGLDL